MNAVPMFVDDLNEDGASYLLERLYGLAQNGISSWQVIGAAMERAKVGVCYSDACNEWDAEVNVGDGVEYSTASNPRLAIARALIKKVLLETSGNSFSLKLPLKTAFAIGFDRDSFSFSILLTSSGGVLDEEDEVLLELKVT